MQDNPQDKPNLLDTAPALHPLKGLTRAQFAALGAHSVVFERTLTSKMLAQLLPQTEIQSDAEVFYLVFSADGSPVLVSDSYEAVEDWLEESAADLAAVH